MKTLTVLNESIKNSKLNIQSNTINYISVNDLKKYLTVANNFLSEESKEIVNYLIVNNSTYIKDLSTDEEENALAGFYNKGVPSDEHLKELYKCIGEVVKSGRILEIPVFQTESQFKKIISGEISPDLIIFDFNNERSRNFIAKKYTPLIHKICKQFVGASNLTYEELMEVAFEGLTFAMNNYGKKKSEKIEDFNNESINSITFGQFAAYMIRFHILNAIRNESRIVRVPINNQNDEKKKTGKITRNNTISGDKVVGIHNSDDGNKTLFDFIDSLEASDAKVNDEDKEKAIKELFNLVEKEFGHPAFDIWCSFNELNGYKKIKNKDLANKFNVSNSSITYYCYKINKFITTDKKAKQIAKRALEIMQECRMDEENRQRDNEPISINKYTPSIDDVI